MKNIFKKEFLKVTIRERLLHNTSFVLAVIGIAIGVLLALNYAQRIPRALTSVLPYIELADVETKLEAQQTSLKNSISTVDEQITALDQQVRGRQGSFKVLVDQADMLKAKAGLTEVAGEGIIIVLDDSDARGANPNSIAHASDMRDLVDHLWNQGATAISIKGDGSTDERIGPSTSIDCIVNTVLINGTKIVPPFEIRAIGNRDKLIAAINDRVALKDIYDRMDKEGLKFSIIDGVNQVTIPKFTGNFITEDVKVK